jgi:hypothetical protein
MDMEDLTIPFSICHNTTKWKELFSLKGTTMFLALIGWITGLTHIEHCVHLPFMLKVIGVYIYIYIYTHTHTRMHTYTYIHIHIHPHNYWFITKKFRGHKYASQLLLNTVWFNFQTYIYIYICVYITCRYVLFFLNWTQFWTHPELSTFCSSLGEIWTHTIDTLQHQSLSLTSSALDHSTTSTP